MVVPRTEKVYEKHAWILVFGIGMAGLVAGLAITVTGSGQLDDGIVRNLTGMTRQEIADNEPGIANLIGYLQRAIGISALSGGVLLVGMAAVAFRRGEKWSWYAILALLVIWIGATVIDVGAGASFNLLVFDLVFALVWLTGLLLPFRRFFPRKP